MDYEEAIHYLVNIDNVLQDIKRQNVPDWSDKKLEKYIYVFIPDTIVDIKENVINSEYISWENIRDMEPDILTLIEELNELKLLMTIVLKERPIYSTGQAAGKTKRKRRRSNKSKKNRQ
jgi:hypothetical protein